MSLLRKHATHDTVLRDGCARQKRQWRGGWPQLRLHPDHLRLQLSPTGLFFKNRHCRSHRFAFPSARENLSELSLAESRARAAIGFALTGGATIYYSVSQ